MEVEITFAPSGLRGRFESGITILEAARQIGVDIDSVCGGRGICGRCQVSLGSKPGVDASDKRLSAPSPLETDYRGRRPLLPNHRLACITKVQDDVVVNVPESSRVHKQVIRKDAGVSRLPVDPIVRLFYVELDPDQSAIDQIPERLRNDHSLVNLAFDESTADVLSRALISATVAVRQGTVIAAWPGFRDEAYGIAFDVGSTTIAGHVCDLASGDILASGGTVNNQIAFGEDLMSRVSFAQDNPQGAQVLTETVRASLSTLTSQLCGTAKIEPASILEVVVVGNPIMHHLVLGLDPTPLGIAPFSLQIKDSHTVHAASLGLPVNPGARLYTLPCVAGHVGADAVAVALAEAPHRQDRLVMIVDVGTNAEILLGNGERLLAASSPTGPTFEGAQISGGQRAAAGAIERVRIDPHTGNPRVKIIGSDLWSDEPGFDPQKITGICGSGIIEAVAEMHLNGLINSDGLIREGPFVIRNGRTFAYRLSDRIAITQNDVRAIQLAKAALLAGARLLMDKMGISEVDEIHLAGAFGSQIDPIYALALGMLPDTDPQNVIGVGNAAGVGALMTLLSDEARQEAEDVAASIEHVEIATESRFQDHFVAAMAFPTRDGTYPHLESRVKLPDPNGQKRTRKSKRR